MIKTTCNIEYHSNDIKKIPNSIGIIAYCGKDWRTGLSKTNSKLIYLIKTIASLSQYVTETHVYHTEDENINFITDHFNKVFTHAINPPMEIDAIDGKIEVLVHPIGKYALLEQEWANFDYVFFNEGDQVIFSKNLQDYIYQLNDYNYLSPHRLERCFRKTNYNKHPLVMYNSVKYVLYNLPKDRTNPLVTECKTFWESYGAAWIAKTNSVLKADFTQPVESGLHVPCLSMFNTLTALKTNNYWDFFVDHLSGYRNALEKGGHDIENFPNCW